MLESLLDNLSTRGIEIDIIEFSGMEFRHIDNRVMSLKLSTRAFARTGASDSPHHAYPVSSEKAVGVLTNSGIAEP
jgi:hypothetical protein